jgi:hypothetical protein
MSPWAMIRCEALTTVNCGSMNFVDPSEHVTVVP